MSSRILPLVARWGLLCALIFPTFAYSQERALVIVSGNSKIYSDFYVELESKLNGNVTLTRTNTSKLTNEILERHDFIIPIGYNAAKSVAKLKIKKTTIYTLIPENTSLQKNILCDESNCYKAYINQPIERYLQLFKVMFSKGKNLVLATTKASSEYSKKIKNVSENIGIVYREINIETSKNVTRTFINKLNRNDVLLALPNSQIYNASNAKSIILSTYHANVPIIAYSKSFAKAGALVSLYSSISNIADKTASIVNSIIKDGPQNKKEYYPDEFSIEINSTVASSLNLDIDTENSIKRRIK